MEPSATYRPMAATMEKPALEIQDFDAVVRLYWARIFRFTLASARDRDAAETLTQECFLKAYRGRESFRGDSSLQTWLMQIAINLVRDFSRSRRLQFWRRSERTGVDLEAPADWIHEGDLSPQARTPVRGVVVRVWRAAVMPQKRQ